MPCTKFAAALFLYSWLFGDVELFSGGEFGYFYWLPPTYSQNYLENISVPFSNTVFLPTVDLISMFEYRDFFEFLKFEQNDGFIF